MIRSENAVYLSLRARHRAMDKGPGQAEMIEGLLSADMEIKEADIIELDGLDVFSVSELNAVAERIRTIVLLTNDVEAQFPEVIRVSYRRPFHQRAHIELRQWLGKVWQMYLSQDGSSCPGKLLESTSKHTHSMWVFPSASLLTSFLKLQGNSDACAGIHVSEIS